MTQKEALQLKEGDKVRITQDTTLLDYMGLPRSASGVIVTVSKAVSNNDEIQVKPPAPNLGNTWYLNCQHISKVTSKEAKTAKAARFNIADAKKIAANGADNLLKSEINIRLNNVRTHASSAGAPPAFHKELRLLNEQLRQAKLLHKLLQKETISPAK